MNPYPVALRLAGRRVVVVGGGAVAAGRIGGLLDAEADVVLIAPAITTGLSALSDAGLVKWIPRRYQRGDLADAWYVLALTDEPAVNEAVAEEAELRGGSASGPTMRRPAAPGPRRSAATTGSPSR